MKINKMVENDLISKDQLTTLALKDIYDVDSSNVDTLPLNDKARARIKTYVSKLEQETTKHNFLTDKNGKIVGVEMDFSKTFNTGKAEYKYLKLELSSWSETDFYGYTKCQVGNDTYTTLVSVSLGNNVSFGEYNFKSKKLEHSVASFIQKVAGRLDKKIRNQK